MQVKAKQLGFYGNTRRRVGDIFEITDEKHFSSKWMDKVKAESPEIKPEPKKSFSKKTKKPSDDADVI